MGRPPCDNPFLEEIIGKAQMQTARRNWEISADLEGAAEEDVEFFVKAAFPEAEQPRRNQIEPSLMSVSQPLTGRVPAKRKNQNKP